MTAPRSFYDVVVVGASLASLAAGALLARRGFRVAVLGHGSLAQTYGYEGMALQRELATVTVAEAPAFRRVVAELALVPAMRRRLRPLEPLYQVALPRHRIDVAGPTGRLLAELRREFPEVQRPVEDFYAALDRANGALDQTFGADVVWPPDGFFERREAARAAAVQPFGRDGASGDVLAEFAANHPFRTFVDAQARFGGAMDPDRMTALCRVRLHGVGTRAAWAAEGGADGLKRLFEEKILQHGGEVRPRDRVERIALRRGRVEGVVLSGLDETLGCSFVVTCLDPAEAQRLTGAPASRAYAQRLLGVRPRYYRYVLNVALPAEAVPVGMGARVFSVADPARPLAEENLLAVEAPAPDAAGRVVLTVGALLPRAAVEEGGGYLRRVRERVLRALGELVPFLDRHVTVVDSPHDGLPLEDRARGTTVTLDVRWSGAPEAMEPVDTVDSPGFLGVCGLPCRGELAGLLHCGRQVVPGLGAEGEFMAALAVARLVTRTDRSKERMRRELWSKVEG